MASQCILPLTRNGVTVAIESLVHELTKRGHYVRVVAPSLKNSPRHSYHIPAQATNLLPSPPDYPLAWRWQPELMNELSKTKWDIVHVHHPFGLGNIGLKLARLQKIPCVATYHTLYDQYAAHYVNYLPSTLVKPVVQHIVRDFFNKCDLLIAPSRYVQDIIKHGSITTPSVVMPSMISLPDKKSQTPAARTEIRQRYGITDNTFVISTVGRLSKEKNLDLLLQSVKLYTDKHDSSLHCLIVGGGKDAQYYKQQASQLHITNNVTFVGSVSPSEVFKYLYASDAFIFPSLTDTQGLVIAQAQACGLPCIAIEKTAASEFIQNGTSGITVSANTDSIVTALSVLRDPLHRQIMSHEAKKAAQDRSPTTHAKDIEAMYLSLINQRSVAKT